ncbi:MAG TPA: hypothetical protein QF873_02645 [Patescibacteria group bacterium]|nr:hypothetical protein [Patescibacteria group bacterium]
MALFTRFMLVVGVFALGLNAVVHLPWRDNVGELVVSSLVIVLVILLSVLRDVIIDSEIFPDSAHTSKEKRDGLVARAEALVEEVFDAMQSEGEAHEDDVMLAWETMLDLYHSPDMVLFMDGYRWGQLARSSSGALKRVMRTRGAACSDSWRVHLSRLLEEDQESARAAASA